MDTVTSQVPTLVPDLVPTPSRRRFLQTSTALATASMLGISGEASAAPALHSKRNLAALARSMAGRLILPGELGYMMAAAPNNQRYADILPVAVAMCANDKDVQLCLRWAIDHRQPFAVRSGGHNYAGFSTTRGLLIDVKAMNGISVNEKENTCTIAAGVSNQDMANFFSGSSLAVPSGRCPTVGAAGLVLGGGWGFSATHAGLTCDSLKSSEIVLPSQQLVVAEDKGSYQDLFWGLRGGGGGNFGVNTSFTFNLVDVSHNVTIFNILWPAQKQIELFSALQDLQQNNPTTISTRSKIVPRRAGSNYTMADLQVTTLGQFFGGKEAAMKALEPVLNMLTPVKADIREMTYWQARDYLITDDPNGMYDLRSSYVGEKMSPEGMEMMVRWMLKWPGGSLVPENMGILFAIGGKVRTVPVNATAYPHRNANYIFEMEAAWGPIDKLDVVQRQQQWLRDYFAAMSPFVLPQAYVNFPNREQPNWAKAYYGPNLDRLKTVKHKYDPHNYFKFEQSIPQG
ncbi:FAD-binding oxidoreductase [Undibacterium sp.]|uniref:FAD-binding oxidoreductase n=1 Tax=Undibacterium sp. TaxID=1914977 RepID=UPI002731D32D|nr:FAD-dependent oxidoreductase [Undibacterium sp.]MDP1980524.1 FAD-dependent oxidoreductase [Undibacterium sp.]